MYKLPVALIAAIIAAPTLWWVNVGQFNASERELFHRVEEVLADATPQSSRIVSVFELPTDCAGKTCYLKPSKVADASYADGNLRQYDEGLIFVLEKMGGQCIRTKMAAKRFGLGDVKESCPHGGCWYRERQYDWGLLAFGLAEPDSTCISSLVFNSEGYQREAP